MTAPSQKVLRCNCGAVANPAWSTCIACGEPLAQEIQKAADAAPPQRRKIDLHAPIVSDFEERAAIVQHDAGIPKEWAEGLARIDTARAPKDIPPARWRRFVDDAGRFLDRWGAQLHALGWRTEDVFGAHRDAPHARVDCAGLAWLIDGQEVVAITEDMATIRWKDGRHLRYVVRKAAHPEAIPVWELQP